MPRGNPENLIPNSQRSPEELRRNCAKGGRKSGETRRRKKILKQRIQEALNCTANDTLKQVLKAVGMETEGATNYDVLVARMLALALGKGDLRAMQVILDYAGETPGEIRAEKQEKREEKLFKLQMEAIDNLDKDNDAVLAYVAAMRKNIKDVDDEPSAAEQETGDISE